MGTAAPPKPGWDLSLAGNPPSRASLFALGDSGAGNAIPGLPGGRQQPRKVPARDGSGYGVQGFVSRLKKKKTKPCKEPGTEVIYVYFAQLITRGTSSPAALGWIRQSCI